MAWQDTRRAYRELLYTAPIGEAGVSGAIMFKETLYQSAADGTPFVDILNRQGVLSGIKVDEVRVLLAAWQQHHAEQWHVHMWKPS
jgi:fructose-bisphosphate aldolase class I